MDKTGSKDVNLIRNSIRTIPDFPKPGIRFRDITTLMLNPEAFNKTIEILYERYKDEEINSIIGIESRGFIFGSLLASKLNKSFILARKPGKLPGKTEKIEYDLEYGKDCVEIHKDAVNSGDKVIVVDDLIATGGTAKAVNDLIEKLKGVVIENAFVIELPDLKGREKLKKVFSIVQFEGD